MAEDNVVVIEEAPRKPVFLTNISTVEQDDACGMRYWLSNIEGGSGIINKETFFSQTMESQIHNDLKIIASMKDLVPAKLYHMVKEITDPLTEADKADTVKMEQLYRRLGLVVAFALFQEPVIRASYITIPIDSSIVLDRNPLWVIVHPDRILKDRKTDEVIYRKYTLQPAGIFHRNWLQSWHYSMELHAGIAAAGEHLRDQGIGIEFGQMLGMGAGYRSNTDGRLIHPYVYGYRNAKTGEWDSSMKEPRKDWSIAPSWEFGGGIVGWVTKLGESVSNSIFHLSPSVTLNNDMLREWTNRRIHRERAVRTARHMSMTNIYQRGINFERRTSQCRPTEGEACQFLKACWRKDFMESPLKSPDFMVNPNSITTEASQA